MPLTGGELTGILKMGSNQIQNVKNPTAGHHAANRDYVDNQVGKKTAMSDIPQPILWKFRRGLEDNPQNLNNGEFTIREKSGGIVDIFFASKDAYGRNV